MHLRAIQIKESLLGKEVSFPLIFNLRKVNSGTLNAPDFVS